MAIKIKPVHCFEFLDEIEKEKDTLKKIKLLKQYGEVPPLNFVLSLNFKHSIKLMLPEGMPPIDPKHLDTHQHPDFAGLLGTQIGKLRHCMVGSKLSKNKMESIFYDVLVNCPVKDMEVLCAAKDHQLEELYPSVTKELVAAVYPGYVGD